MSAEIFAVTETEYKNLDDKFGKLCYYAARQLKSKNSKNNYYDDPEDIVQELRIALTDAGKYYKRQTYIENSFAVLSKHVKDLFTKKVLKQLQKLWKDRTRHGANRQKFGPYQEEILESLVTNYVPMELRPSKSSPLIIDAKFIKYCKQITWNRQRAMGKKITREKFWRTGLVSLSDFDYLSAL
jgi:hypothetical protein